MILKECMTQDVKLASPSMSILQASQLMRDGDFGVLPVGENDRLIGMVTDRDIAIRGVAEGKAPTATVGEILTGSLLYAYEDQEVQDVARYMGEHQVRRLPVLNRSKRMVGIVSLGDLSIAEPRFASVPLSEISSPNHSEPTRTQ